MENNSTKTVKVRIKFSTGEEFEAEGDKQFIAQEKDIFLRIVGKKTLLAPSELPVGRGAQTGRATPQLSARERLNATSYLPGMGLSGEVSNAPAVTEGAETFSGTPAAPVLRESGSRGVSSDVTPLPARTPDSNSPRFPSSSHAAFSDENSGGGTTRFSDAGQPSAAMTSVGEPRSSDRLSVSASNFKDSPASFPDGGKQPFPGGEPTFHGNSPAHHSGSGQAPYSDGGKTSFSDGITRHFSENSFENTPRLQTPGGGATAHGPHLPATPAFLRRSDVNSAEKQPEQAYPTEIWEKLCKTEGETVFLRRKHRLLTPSYAALLVLAGAKTLLNTSQYSALALAKSMKQAGFLGEGERLDRVLAAEIRQKIITFSGQKRSRSYQLSDEGFARAYIFAQKIAPEY